MHEINETSPEFREYSLIGGYPHLYQVRTVGPGHPWTETLCAGCAREAYEAAEDECTGFYQDMIQDDTEHECDACGRIINERDPQD